MKYMIRIGLLVACVACAALVRGQGTCFERAKTILWDLQCPKPCTGVEGCSYSVCNPGFDNRHCYDHSLLQQKLQADVSLSRRVLKRKAGQRCRWMFFSAVLSCRGNQARLTSPPGPKVELTTLRHSVAQRLSGELAGL